MLVAPVFAKMGRSFARSMLHNTLVMLYEAALLCVDMTRDGVAHVRLFCNAILCVASAKKKES